MTARPALSQEIEALIDEAARDICAQPFGVKSAVSRRLRFLALEVASSVRKADAEIARGLPGTYPGAVLHGQKIAAAIEQEGE